MEKNNLPPTTRIAVWLTAIAGIKIAMFSLIFLYCYRLRRFMAYREQCLNYRFFIFPFTSWIEVFFGQFLSWYLWYSLILGLFFLILSWHILKRKKTAWIFLVLLLFLRAIEGGGGILGLYLGPLLVGSHVWPSICELLFTFIFLSLSVAPLVLFLLDRKNFWKII